MAEGQTSGTKLSELLSVLQEIADSVGPEDPEIVIGVDFEQAYLVGDVWAGPYLADDQVVVQIEPVFEAVMPDGSVSKWGEHLRAVGAHKVPKEWDS